MRLHYFGQVNFPKNLYTLPRSVKILSFVIFVYYLGWGIAIPFLPLYFKDVLGTYTKVGLATAFLPLFQVIWSLVLGKIEDNFPKKFILTFILFLYLPLSYLLLILKTFVHFFWFRIYHSFLASSFWLTSEAYARQHSPQDKTAESIGLFNSSWGLSVVLGTAVSGFLFLIFRFSIFWFISIFALLAMILTLFLPDKRKNRFHKITLSQEICDFLKNKNLTKLALFLSFTFFCTGFLEIILPLFLKNLGASFVLIGLIVALFYLPLIFESYFSTFENKKLLAILALVSSPIIFLSLYFVSSFPLIFLFSFLIALCFSAIHPIFSGRLTNLMSKRKIGELTSVLFALKSLSLALSLIFAGIISDLFGLRYVFLIGFFGFLILLASALKSRTLLNFEEK